MTEENISIAEQGDIFVEMQKKFSKLGRKEFIEAQKLILDEFELKTGNSSKKSGFDDTLISIFSQSKSDAFLT